MLTKKFKCQFRRILLELRRAEYFPMELLFVPHFFHQCNSEYTCPIEIRDSTSVHCNCFARNLQVPTAPNVNNESQTSSFSFPAFQRTTISFPQPRPTIVGGFCLIQVQAGDSAHSFQPLLMRRRPTDND